MGQPLQFGSLPPSNKRSKVTFAQGILQMGQKREVYEFGNPKQRSSANPIMVNPVCKWGKNHYSCKALWAQMNL